MSDAYPTSSTGSGKVSGPQGFKFDYHLDSLKGEFDVLVEEIESLRKERDEYKARVEVQAEEILGVRRDSVCQRCREQTMVDDDIRTIAISSSRPVAQPKCLDKSITSDSLDGGVVPQQTTHPSMNLIRRTPTHPSQSGFHSTSRPVDPIIVDSVTLLSPSSQSPTSNFDPDTEGKERNWSIDGSEAENELDLDIAYVLPHRERIWCVKFSQDGKFLATGCRNGKAHIYDVQTGTLTSVLRNSLAEHDSIRAVCFSPDGKYLATSSSDANIYIWEICTKYVRNVFKGHTDFICSLDFSPNGRLLVSASYDNTVQLWNVRYGAWKILTDKNHSFLNYDYYKSAKFSPDGRYVAASHYDGEVRIWDGRLGQLMRRVTAHVDLVNDIAFMPDGKGLVSGGRDMTLKYWDVSSLDAGPCAESPLANKIQRYFSGVEELTRPERHFSGHEDSVYSLSISSDGRWVASGSDDQSIRIWDAHTAKVECILDCITNDDNGEVNSVDFNPAGRYLAAGGDDGTVRIWRYSLEPQNVGMSVCVQ